MADDRDMYASLSLFSSLPHIRKNEFYKGPPCAHSKILDAFSIGKPIVVTAFCKVYPPCRMLLPCQSWNRFIQAQFSSRTAIVQFAKKVSRIERWLGIFLMVV